MTSFQYSADIGSLSDESDRRFRRVLMALLLPALIAGIAIPFIHLAVELITHEQPERRVKVLQPPKPKPPPQKAEEPKPQTQVQRPQLTPEQRLARAKANVSKLMRNFDELQALRDPNMPVAPQVLTREIVTSATGTRSIASDPDKTSGGIGDTHAVQRTAGTGIGSRSTTTVESGIGSGGGTGGSGTGDRHVPGRTFEEIQVVFERNHGGFYSMYQRERRTHPDLAGKVVVRLTIAPSGRVTACKLVSSELQDPEFEQSIVTRILSLDFGAKDVGETTVDYPILFFPA